MPTASADLQSEQRRIGGESRCKVDAHLADMIGAHFRRDLDAAHFSIC